MIRVLFALLALATVIPYRLSRIFLGEEKAWRGFTERLSLLTGYLGLYCRMAAYRQTLSRCAVKAQIGFGTVLSKADSEIGEHVYVGRYCSLGWVRLEREVMIADFVSIPSGGGTHRLRPGSPPRLQENNFRPIRVGEGSWIGTGAVVMADIGNYCIVGAGAVVTRAIPDHSIAVGVPAKVVGRTDEPEAA